MSTVILLAAFVSYPQQPDMRHFYLLFEHAAVHGMNSVEFVSIRTTLQALLRCL